MADKEIFQKVNEIDLEALIDNIQGEKNIYMSHANYLVNILKVTWHVYYVDEN